MGSKHDEQPIWLVWSMSRWGVVVLRSICTDINLANQHRKRIEHCEIDDDFGTGNTIRVWVERSTSNHLFGAIAQFKTEL